MKLRSPGKVNLFLNVTEKRDDGYHNLESLFVPIQLSDEIIITFADSIMVETPGLTIIQNTVLKAANLLRDFYGIKDGAHIVINKHIPIASGLGGSSTNAGTVIRWLPKFWNLKTDDDELKHIALKIGADVPYFLNPVTAFVSGIGEVIKPITLNKKLHLVLVHPYIEIFTNDVYRVGVKSFSKSIKNDKKSLLENLFFGKNDLEAAAISINPKIGKLLSEIKTSKGCIFSRMSGSGSTCFGVFENENSAFEAKKAFEKRYFSYYEHIEI